MNDEWYWNQEEVLAIMGQHNPDGQDDPYHDRCSLCHFTCHPCEVFSLCGDWLRFHAAQTVPLVPPAE